MVSNTIKMKAGKYTIGDPCYVVPKEMWKDFCAALNTKSNEFRCIKAFVFRGHEFYVSDTYEGDGHYGSNHFSGTGFSVDSGLIGAVPGAFILEFGCRSKASEECICIDVGEYSTAEYNDGRITFDELEIYTRR